MRGVAKGVLVDRPRLLVSRRDTQANPRRSCHLRMTSGACFTRYSHLGVERGGNVAVHVYPVATLEGREVEALQRLFDPLGGVVEAPEPPSFVVVTVPVSAGFSAIEDAMDIWLAVRSETTWYFGNVYDES